MAEYLKNCWYAAALAEELSPDKAFARIILGDRIALFRAADGAPAALFDRCPHRFAQLHEGRLSDGIVECPYHGLQFNTAGECVANPHGDNMIPPRARVRSYPVAERYGVIWVWPGEAEKADAALIPDLSSVVSPEPNAMASGYMHTAANYELITDNLMDLSHADYVHRESLNTGGALSRLRPTVKANEDSVQAYWQYETAHVQPFFRSALPDPDGLCIQSFRMHWTPPSNLILDVTARNSNQPAEAYALYTTAHLLTPETQSTTHYWFKGLRNWAMDDAELNAALGAGLAAAFEFEDKPMLHSVQESMAGEDLWDLEPVILSCDPGAIHARRMLQKRKKLERNLSAAA